MTIYFTVTFILSLNSVDGWSVMFDADTSIIEANCPITAIIIHGGEIPATSESYEFSAEDWHHKTTIQSTSLHLLRVENLRIPLLKNGSLFVGLYEKGKRFYTNFYTVRLKTRPSNICSKVAFKVDDALLDTATVFPGDIMTIAFVILSRYSADVTKSYISGGATPDVRVFNGSTSFTLQPVLDSEKGEWKFYVDSEMLLNPFNQNDFNILVSFTSYHIHSCSIRDGSLIVAMPGKFLHNIASIFDLSQNTNELSGQKLEIRKSPCSSIIKALLIRGDAIRIGITLGEFPDTKWYEVNNDFINNANILDVVFHFDNNLAVATKDGVYFIHSTFTKKVPFENVETMKVHAADICYGDLKHVFIVIVNTSSVYSIDLQSFTKLLVYDANETDTDFLDARYDIIKNLTAVYTFSEGRKVLNIIYFQQFANHQWKRVSSNTLIGLKRLSIRGIHYHYPTFKVYLYGSVVMYSNGHGFTFTTILTLPEDDVVVEMTSSSLSGDVVAVNI